MIVLAYFNSCPISDCHVEPNGDKLVNRKRNDNLIYIYTGYGTEPLVYYFFYLLQAGNIKGTYKLPLRRPRLTMTDVMESNLVLRI